jgi:hypothetical protein
MHLLKGNNIYTDSLQKMSQNIRTSSVNIILDGISVCHPRFLMCASHPIPDQYQEGFILTLPKQMTD